MSGSQAARLCKCRHSRGRGVAPGLISRATPSWSHRKVFFMQKRSIDPVTLATAGENSKPLFESAVLAATTALVCDLSVQVICLSGDQLHRWQAVFDLAETGNLSLQEQRPQIHDLNRATLSEWKTTLGEGHADLTVLAGFHTAQRRHEISASYANALVQAVPSGMVVMA
jgi:hypothetical protein